MRTAPASTHPFNKCCDKDLLKLGERELQLRPCPQAATTGKAEGLGAKQGRDQGQAVLTCASGWLGFGSGRWGREKGKKLWVTGMT